MCRSSHLTGVTRVKSETSELELSSKKYIFCELELSFEKLELAWPVVRAVYITYRVIINRID